MKINFYSNFQDNRPVEEFITLLNSYLKNISISYIGNQPIQEELLSEKNLRSLSKKVKSKSSDFTIFVHETPFIDNYYSHFIEGVYFVSLYNWERLSRLPPNNGILYFISSFIAEFLDNSYVHRENNGCIYSFLEDKRGIDDGMTSAFLCNDCLNRVVNNISDEQKKYLKDLEIILDILSNASRRNMDVLDFLRQQKINTQINIEHLPERALYNVLVKIFQKLNFREVRITHGPNEIGKDIIFYCEDNLMRKYWTACVVKAIQIGNRQIADIQNQLYQAQTPLLFPNGNQIFFDRFIVITNKRYTIQAVTILAGNPNLAAIRDKTDFWDISIITDLILENNITLD